MTLTHDFDIDVKLFKLIWRAKDTELLLKFLYTEKIQIGVWEEVDLILLSLYKDRECQGTCEKISC